MLSETARDSAVGDYYRSFSATTTLYYAGAPATELYLIREGSVRLFKRARGVERSVRVCGPEELLGEEALVPGSYRSATAEAIEPVSALVIESDTFRTLLHRRPGIAESVIEQLARRLRGAEAQIENLLLPDPTHRVVHALVHSLGEAPSTSVRLSPLELSNRTALDPDDLKIVVRELERRGYLEIGDQTITVANEQALRRLRDLLALKEEVRLGLDCR